MKKLLPVVFLILISSFCFADSKPTYNTYDNLSDILSKEFFGVAWGKKMPGGLTYKTIDAQGIEIYTKNLSVRFRDIPISEVLFGFYKEKFCSADLRFLGRDNYEKIKQILQSAEGGTFSETPARGKVLTCSWLPSSPQPDQGSVTLLFDETVGQGDLMFINLKQDLKK